MRRQARCEFNAYCKRTLRSELIDACRSSTLPVGRKATSGATVLLFRHDRRLDRGADEAAPQHSTEPFCFKNKKAVNL